LQIDVKLSTNTYAHNSPTLQTDGLTTFNSNTVLCGDLAQPLTQQERPIVRDDYCYGRYTLQPMSVNSLVHYFCRV